MLAVVIKRKKRKKLRLLFIHTGGTIASVEINNVRTLSNNNKLPLLNTLTIDYDEIFLLSQFSEYTSHETLNKIINCVQEQLENIVYDSVIILTGTDCLVYTAAALSLIFNNIGTKIVLVSANHPLGNPKSNGYDNLTAAISFAIQDKTYNGVFVSYKNTSDNFVTIHNGYYLLEHASYDDSLYSLENLYVAHVSRDDQHITYNEDYIPYMSGTNIKSIKLQFRSFKQNKSILRIKAHPDMVYPKLSDDIKYVLYETYHSGTINTKDEAFIKFHQECRDKNITIFLVGVDKDINYESMSVYKELRLIVLPKMTPIVAYIKLWLL